MQLLRHDYIGRYRKPISSYLLSCTRLTRLLVLLSCFIFSFLLTMMLAWVSEKWIEKPGIDFGRKLIRKIKGDRKLSALRQ